MRMDGYDKWLMAGADSSDEGEKEFDEYLDEVVIGCMNGDDELPDFISDDCTEINSEITQLLAKNHTMDMSDEEAAMVILKLLYGKFVTAIEKQAEYNRIWSH